MATAAPPAASPRVHAGESIFFHLSLVCLAIGVGGFTPTYWLQVPVGAFRGSPLLHIHALIFTAWLLLLVGQTWQISHGRIRHHRAWGLVGISLATLMLVIGYASAIVGLEGRLASGYGERALAFHIVPFFSVTAFFGFFIAAIANIRRPDWHGRFIIVATTIVLQAAMARVFFLYRQGFEWGVLPGDLPPPPVNASLPAFALVALIIVAGIIHDWRTRGKPHAAWTIGLTVLTLGELLRAPVSRTQAWQSFAEWTTRIAG